MNTVGGLAALMVCNITVCFFGDCTVYDCMCFVDRQTNWNCGNN